MVVLQVTMVVVLVLQYDLYSVIVVSSYFESYCYFLKTKLYFGFEKKVVVSPPGHSI